ncbi:MAG TPA: ethanolamine ammonia-lyase subunit EutC [Acidobacteriaceae bacterium]|jgi:ethanolamine ammonia-lyase small subunit|nr:ethanolamine ammonia-lyase subunit EutC [Acidobacteriaceae bacterium]
MSDDSLSARLRRWTPARVSLGRVGSSLPTRPLLQFDLDHARARDAVYAEMGCDALAAELRGAAFGEPVAVRSLARDRREYLLRPDLGRTLDAASRRLLAASPPCDLAVVIADGLSALAPERHAVALLRELHPAGLAGSATVVLARGARVALGDQIGSLLHASAVVVLIGERPGLSSPDSLGVYLTWAPQVGRTDAERNCVSNIRPAGLPYADAARKIDYLLHEARKFQRSGIALKDDSESSGRRLGESRRD